MKDILGIIPARYASTRFPGKPLADINGKSMVRRVYEQAAKASCLRKVIVATDDERIAKHVREFGGHVSMTSPDHPSGTDRCREVLEQQQEAYDYAINIQGDEPFIDPQQIDTLGSLLDGNTQLATLIRPVTDAEKLLSPNVVKVVTDINGRALYFSRHPIPYLRGEKDSSEWPTTYEYFIHVGIYAYRTDVLRQITSLSPSSLELAESLEQLRWLQNGYGIKTAITLADSHGVDTPEDLEKLRDLFT